MGRIFLCSDYGGAGFLPQNHALSELSAGESERKRKIWLILRKFHKFQQISTTSPIFPTKKAQSSAKSKMGQIFLCSDYGGAGFSLQNHALAELPAGESERKRKI